MKKNSEFIWLKFLFCLLLCKDTLIKIWRTITAVILTVLSVPGVTRLILLQRGSTVTFGNAVSLEAPGLPEKHVARP